MSELKKSNQTHESDRRLGLRILKGTGITAGVLALVGYCGVLPYMYDKDREGLAKIEKAKYEDARRAAEQIDGIILPEYDDKYAVYRGIYDAPRYEDETVLQFGKCVVEGGIVAVDNPSQPNNPDVSYVLPLNKELDGFAKITVANSAEIAELSAYKDCFAGVK